MTIDIAPETDTAPPDQAMLTDWAQKQGLAWQLTIVIRMVEKDGYSPANWDRLSVTFPDMEAAYQRFRQAVEIAQS